MKLSSGNAALILKNSRIHICYSDRHYSPYSKKTDKYWYSCSQIAYHLWQGLTKLCENVSYGDEIPAENIDLLWTNREVGCPDNVKKIIYFASVAHHFYVDESVRALRNLAGSNQIEGLISREKRREYWLTLNAADVIFVIGNNTVANSFYKYMPKKRDELVLANCGVDYERYGCANELTRTNTFIYSATRFSLRKGSHIIAGAWRHFSEEHDDCWLNLLGRDGDYNLRNKMSGMPNVNFLGEFESGSSVYIKHLCRARWVLLPSIAEGQAGTLLEAMCCGCIPISSRISGIDAEKYGGYVLSPNNADKLYEVMCHAFYDWKTSKADIVRNRVQQWHNWKLFEEKIYNITLRTLRTPRKGKRRRWLYVTKYFFGFR